jgi:hypothetical protein
MANRRRIGMGSSPRVTEHAASRRRYNRLGRGTVQLASQAFRTRSFDTKRSQKSPAWITNSREIPVAR